MHKQVIFALLICSIVAWNDYHDSYCPASTGSNNPTLSMNYKPDSLQEFSSAKELLAAHSLPRFTPLNESVTWTTAGYFYYVNSGNQLQINILSPNGDQAYSQTISISPTASFIDAHRGVVVLDEEGSTNFYKNNYNSSQANLVKSSSFSMMAGQTFEGLIIADDFFFSSGQSQSSSKYYFLTKSGQNWKNWKLYQQSSTQGDPPVQKSMITFIPGTSYVNSTRQFFVQFDTVASPPAIKLHIIQPVGTLSVNLANRIDYTQGDLHTSNIQFMSFTNGFLMATSDATTHNSYILYFDAFQEPNKYQQFKRQPTYGLKVQTDHQSYYIRMDGLSGSPSQVESLDIFWVNTQDSEYQNFYRYQQHDFSSLSAQTREQIFADFFDAQKYSVLLQGFGSIPGLTHSQELFVYLYKNNQITLYSHRMEAVSNTKSTGPVSSFTYSALQKQYQITVSSEVQRLLLNEEGSSYEFTVKGITCSCSLTSLTNFICFYGADACTFTIQTMIGDCTEE